MKLLKYFSLAFLLLSCAQKKENTAESLVSNSNSIEITNEQFEKNDMTIGGLEKHDFPEVVTVNGLIDVPPENRVIITAVLGGYIEHIPLLEGDTIEKGQLLVTLKNPEFIKLQQEYLEISEQLVYLRSEYERHQTLFKENISSEKNYLKTESTYKAAKARHLGLKKQLQLLNISSDEVEKGNLATSTSIKAPISGTITDVFVTKGTFVSPVTPIMKLVDNSHIHLELSVFERDIMNIKKGQSIEFRIPEVTHQTFKGEVHLVGTTISENRTIKVHGHLKNNRERFLTGMYIEADIIIKNESALALPENSVVGIGGAFYALRLVSQDNAKLQFEKVRLSTGKAHKGFLQINDQKTVREDDQFLTSGAFGLLKSK